MFTHCGGKDRLATVVRALREVDVPVRVAVDFDVLNDEYPLRAILESAGGKWADVESDWKEVKKAVDSKKAELNAADVVREIQSILGEVKEATFPRTAVEKVRKIFRSSSPWAIAKEVGKGFIPAGQATQAYERLAKALRALAIHIVEVGELEGFARSVGNHGPRWVNEVLKRNLATDAELESARRYAMSLVE
jgi:aminoglycoside phosphotransferase (APT) family kinase protein